MTVTSSQVDITRAQGDKARELCERAVKATLRSHALHHQALRLARSQFGLRSTRPAERAGSPRAMPLDEVPRLRAELDQALAEIEHLQAALRSRDLIWEAKLIIAAASAVTRRKLSNCWLSAAPGLVASPSRRADNARPRTRVGEVTDVSRNRRYTGDPSGRAVVMEAG